MIAGAAYVEEHPKGSGKHRVKARVEGRLRTIAAGLSAAAADEAKRAYNARREGALADGVTLAAFGEGFLDRRELAGVRSIRTDRNYWKNHIAAAPIGKLPLSKLGPGDVFDWASGLTGIKYRTKVKIRNLLRVALREAVERRLIEHNPAREVAIHRSGAARTTDDLEGILTPAEQRRLLDAVEPRHRPLVQFALFTGLRQAEQWWLHWEDVHGGYVVVRRSTKGLAPKSGKIRQVHLLPEARAALALLRRRGDLVFAGARGGRRSEGKAPRQWASWLKAAGIKRRVRWHDLRHTCATSLLAGWWGRKWTVDEVCSLLGHSSVTVTERYAKKLDETQKTAVAATPGPTKISQLSSQRGSVSAGADSGIRTPDLRFTKALEFAAESLGLARETLPPGSNDDELAFLVAIAEGLERAQAYQASKAKARRVIPAKRVQRRRKGVA